jgi:hypothetical protein
MPAIINDARLKLIEYRMAVFWFCLFTINSLCSSITIALTNATWNTMDGQSKLLVFIGVIWSWTGTIMAFISNSASRIKQTGELFPANDSKPTDPK